MIVIVDYQMGNTASILNMLRRIGAAAKISALASDIETADKLILPGVGAFDSGMENLNQRDLVRLLTHQVLVKNIPILGICLGMQLMTQNSEEGKQAGLGWIEAQTVKFRFTTADPKLKIPHMGWNFVQPQKESVLYHNLTQPRARFYFVHSYHVVCRQPSDVLTHTEYGCPFVSSIQRQNIFGVQFHPEKSHQFGMALLKNFATF